MENTITPEDKILYLSILLLKKGLHFISRNAKNVDKSKTVKREYTKIWFSFPNKEAPSGIKKERKLIPIQKKK